MNVRNGYKRLFCDKTNIQSLEEIKIFKSKSTSNMKDLLIQDESFSKLNVTTEAIQTEATYEKSKQTLPILIEQICGSCSKNNFFKEICHLMHLHYSYIEKLKSDKIIDDIVNENIDHFTVPPLYHHVEINKVAESLFDSTKDRALSQYFAYFVKNLLFYLINVEKFIDEIKFFNVNFESMFSIHDTKNSNLNQICLMIMKIIEDKKNPNSKNYSEKSSILVKDNVIDNEMETELTRNHHLFGLSSELKINLCISLLEAINEKSINQAHSEERTFYELKDTRNGIDLKFHHFKFAKNFLIIEQDNKDWFYLKSSNSIEKIRNFISKNYSQNKLLIEKLEMILESNSHIVEARNSIMFTSDVSGYDTGENESLSSSSFIDYDDLNDFDMDLNLTLKDTNLLEVDVEAGILKLLKRLLISNFVDREIVLNDDKSIKSFRIDQTFESAEIKTLLDSVSKANGTLLDAEDLDESIEPLFGSTEWLYLSESLRIDYSLTDMLNMNIKIENLKYLIVSLLNVVRHSYIKKSFFIKSRIDTWIQCIEKSNSKRDLKFLLYFLDANIKWEKTLENEVCNICQNDMKETKDLKEAFKNPNEFIKQKCEECGIVFHLNCCLDNKLKLYELNQRDYITQTSPKLYKCHLCVLKSGLDSIYVNSRALRNTRSRKQNSIQKNIPLPATKIGREISKLASLPESSKKIKRKLPDREDSIPLSQLKQIKYEYLI